jgi:predicted aminopeptidase
MQWRPLAFALALQVPASGCYFARAAWEEARILAARQPIDALVARRSAPDSVRRKLRLVLDARRFARSSLGLRVGESFTTYSDIGRDTLLLLLSAAYRDTLRPYVWRFPIVGHLPYRGYFDFSEARHAAATLGRAGFDTYLRPSDAFSTLGWFNDPLLNTTLARDSLELVNTVLHELTHNTLFLKGRAEFNESFASFVGARAAEAFYRSRGAEVAAMEVEARWRDEKILAAFWRRLAHSLDSAFAAHPGSRIDRLTARDSVFAAARRELVGRIGLRLRTVSPLYGERVALNNASVLARRVYGRGLELFDVLYWCEGRSLSQTIKRVTSLVRGKREDPFTLVGSWARERCPALLREAGVNPDDP